MKTKFTTIALLAFGLSAGAPAIADGGLQMHGDLSVAEVRAEAAMQGYNDGYHAGYNHCDRGDSSELRRYLEIGFRAAFPLLTTQRLLLQPLARFIRDEKNRTCDQRVTLNGSRSWLGEQSYRLSCLDAYTQGFSDCTAEQSASEESASDGFDSENYCGVLVCR